MAGRQFWLSKTGTGLAGKVEKYLELERKTAAGRAKQRLDELLKFLLLFGKKLVFEGKGFSKGDELLRLAVLFATACFVLEGEAGAGRTGRAVKAEVGKALAAGLERTWKEFLEGFELVDWEFVNCPTWLSQQFVGAQLAVFRVLCPVDAGFRSRFEAFWERLAACPAWGKQREEV